MDPMMGIGLPSRERSRPSPFWSRHELESMIFRTCPWTVGYYSQEGIAIFKRVVATHMFFFIITLIWGKMNLFWRAYFFRWVGSTTNSLCFQFGPRHWVRSYNSLFQMTPALMKVIRKGWSWPPWRKLLLVWLCGNGAVPASSKWPFDIPNGGHLQ